MNPASTSTKEPKVSKRFVHKPLVVEAVQWFRVGDDPRVLKMLATAEGEEPHTDTMEEAWGEHASVFYAVNTPEGTRSVAPGDWIITQPNGAVHTCSPEAFALAYGHEDAGGAGTTEPDRNFRGETLAEARQQLVDVLKSQKSWLTGYAEAYVDDFVDMATGQARPLKSTQGFP